MTNIVSPSNGKHLPENGSAFASSRGLALFVLMLVYTLNFVDRQIMGILVEPVRKDLALEDWQLGVIMGFGFAITYSLFGLPAAVLAERTNRAKFVSWALGIWSLMTVICGMTQNAMQLLLARIGVGLGEAGGSPPSQSLISDMYSKNDRARALGFWALGAPIGTALGVIGGAWVAQEFGWRVAFFAAGAPGILLALVVRSVIRDNNKSRTAEVKKKAPFSAALTLSLVVEVLKCPPLLLAGLGTGVATAVNYTTVLWGPTYFIRQFDLTAVQVSYFAALILGLASALGTYAGGFIIQKLGPRWKTSYADLPGIGFLLAAPLYWLVLSIDNALAAVTVLLIPTIVYSLWVAPTFALFQNEAPEGERAIATAVLFMVVNVIGLGIGPTLVGAISSALSESLGLAGGLRAAIAIVVIALLPASALMFVAGRMLKRRIVVN